MMNVTGRSNLYDTFRVLIRWTMPISLIWANLEELGHGK
jgi:hypothetical protein